MIICNDDTLLIELGALLGERFRTHTVDSPAEIAAAVSATRWIGIVDVDSFAEARAAISRLEIQFPRCPLILIVPRPAEWHAAVARGAAVAAIARQEMLGPRLIEALASAESRLRADGDSSAFPAAALPETGSSKASHHPRGSATWIAAVAVAGIAAGAGWWMMHQPRPASVTHLASSPTAVGTDAATAGASDGSAAASTAVKPQSVLELLSAARIAFRDQKLLLPRPDGEPRGDSALELYAQVISQDSGNDEALDGVRRLFAIGKARIQGDLAAGKLDDATRLLGLFRDAGVSGSELDALSASIAAARPKWLELHAQQSIAAGDLKGADQLLGELTAAGADPGAIAPLRRALDAKGVDLQLTKLAAQMRDAITAGSLLPPATDDARTYLVSMRALSRTSPLTLAAQRELQAALLSRGTDAIHGSQLDAAQRLLTAATELGPYAPAAEARRELQTALYAAAHPRPAAPKAEATTQSAPAPTPSPAAAVPVAPAYIAAHPSRPLSLSYPNGQGESGSVTVQFTLQANGSAQNVTVVQSDLPTIFSRVAIAAVARGRYETHELRNGEPVQARLRLRFQPN